MNTSKQATAIVLAVVLAISLLACTQRAAEPGAAPNEPAVEATAQGSPEATQQSVPESPTAQDASGAWAIVEQKCTVCHTIERVTQSRKDWTGWNGAVDHMVENGAKLTTDERKAVVDYLASRQ